MKKKRIGNNRIYEDLVGKRFGMLVVIRFDHSNNGRFWLCKCDCGKECIRNTGNLLSPELHSCGCAKNILRFDNIIQEKIKHIGEKYGHLTIIGYKIGKEYECLCDCGNTTYAIEYNLLNGNKMSCGFCHYKGLEFGESAFRELYYNYKRNAERRNLSFDITTEDFRNITKMNCYYCGKEPSQEANHNKTRRGSYIYNGIDRIDNSIGYALDNIVPCCNFCNHAKKDYTKDNFINNIINIYKNLLSKNIIN